MYTSPSTTAFFNEVRTVYFTPIHIIALGESVYTPEYDFMREMKVDSVALQLTRDIYAANSEITGTGAVRIEREARIRRVASERIMLERAISAEINGTWRD